MSTTVASIEEVITQARRERKISRRVNLAFGVSIVLLLAAVVYVFVTYQPQTACSTDPSSKECQQIRASGAKAQNQRVACIPFRQIGYVCPAPTRVTRILRKFKRKDPDAKRPKEGPHASQAPSTPGAQSGGGSSTTPSPDNGGSGGSDGGVGSVPQTPPETPPPGPQGPPGPTGPPGPSAPPSEPDDPSIGGGVNGVVEGVGETVQGTKDTVCGVAGVCLP